MTSRYSYLEPSRNNTSIYKCNVEGCTAKVKLNENLTKVVGGNSVHDHTKKFSPNNSLNLSITPKPVIVPKKKTATTAKNKVKNNEAEKGKDKKVSPSENGSFKQGVDKEKMQKLKSQPTVKETNNTKGLKNTKSSKNSINADITSSTTGGQSPSISGGDVVRNEISVQTDEITLLEDWQNMKKGLVDKIFNQEIELEKLKSENENLKVQIQLRDNCSCGPSRLDPRSGFSPRAPVPAVKPKKRIIPVNLSMTSCKTSSPAMTTIRYTTQVNTPPNPSQTSKCFLTGDSHLRWMSQELSSILPPNQKVESVFHPGACYKDIANVHTNSPNLMRPGPEDTIVIYCGTNDIGYSKWKDVKKGLDVLINKFKACGKVCIIGVPMRLASKKMNYHIAGFNTKLKYYVTSKLPGVRYVNPFNFIKSKHFAKDGLHLNATGKTLMCRKIATELSKKVQVSNDTKDSSKLSRFRTEKRKVNFTNPKVNVELRLT
uniref:SGNH hydrolase-type esterase domain-containing protein n=2 Tax=Cacopsylla melanoneura TaxID=428564 RepID=A0A8D8VVE2_9HEMI